MCSTLPDPRINPELQCQHTWSSKQCSAGIPSVTPSISVSLTVWLCILIWATEVFSFFHFFSYLWLCLNTQMACYPSFTLGWVLSIWSPVVAAPDAACVPFLLLRLCISRKLISHLNIHLLSEFTCFFGLQGIHMSCCLSKTTYHQAVY